MIEIRPIKPHEWHAAKRLIYSVARDVFSDPLPVDEIMARFEAGGTLADMEDIQANYFDRDGIFLVMTRNRQIICTGAIRPLDARICELKRLWLLTAFQGQGLGYRMIQELLAFARKKGYRRVRLETDPIHQKRAIGFYKQLGFHEIPVRNAADDEDIVMEMVL